MTRTTAHDATHYTQGLELDGERFLESVGRYGQSAVFAKSRDSGAVLRKFALPDAWFGEGLTQFGGRIFVLTWREQTAQLLDHELRPTTRVSYRGEGWGLTHDDAQLIMSDGSATLQFRDPQTFEVQRSVQVRDGMQLVPRLNELEYARGLVFANVWMTDRIAAIDPADGRVRAWLDLSALKQALDPAVNLNPDYVLNGIAYDEQTDRFYVTGKCWPTLFELEVEPLPQP